MHLHERTNIIQVTQSRCIVDVALQFEAYKPLYADDTQASYRRVAPYCLAEQAARKGAMRIKQIETFRSAHIVGGVFTAV